MGLLWFPCRPPRSGRGGVGLPIPAPDGRECCLSGHPTTEQG